MKPSDVLEPAGHRLRAPFERIRPAAAQIVEAGAAAGAAWAVSRYALGHRAPAFAPIAALISLTATVGERGRQAVELILGIVVGITLSNLLVLAIGDGAWQMALVVIIAMTLATGLGFTPFVVSQAAVWSVIVISLGAHGLTGALHRFEDGLVGGGIALVIVQLVAPADPRALVASAAQPVYDELARILDQLGVALESLDEESAREAVIAIERLDARRLHEAVANARAIVRRAPRRRHLRDWLERWSHALAELDAVVSDLLVLAKGAQRLMRDEDSPPAQTAEALRDLARRYSSLPEAVAAGDPIEQAVDVTEALRALERRENLGAALVAQQLAAVAEETHRMTASG